MEKYLEKLAAQAGFWESRSVASIITEFSNQGDDPSLDWPGPQ